MSEMIEGTGWSRAYVYDLQGKVSQAVNLANRMRRERNELAWAIETHRREVSREPQLFPRDADEHLWAMLEVDHR